LDNLLPLVLETFTNSPFSEMCLTGRKIRRHVEGKHKKLLTCPVQIWLTNERVISVLTLMHMENLTGWSQFYTPVPLPFQLKPYLPSVESCHMSDVPDTVDQNMYSDHW